MRALLVDPSNYTPYYDYSLCKALREAGCEAELVTSPFLYDDLPNPDGLPIHYLFYRALGLPLVSRFPFARAPGLRKALKAVEYPFDLLALGQYLKSHKPDIVHFQWAVFPLLDWVVFRKLRWRGIQIAYTVHDLLPHREWPWHRWEYARLYREADWLFVHGQKLKTEIVEAFDLDPDRVQVIPQGNLDDFQGEPVSREKAKDQLGIKENHPLILFFGGIEPYKGLAYLLRAFPMVKREVPGAKLLIAGRPREDISRYQRLVDELEIGEDVSIHPRFIPQREMPIYFSAADVVALPYVKTYQSNVLVAAYTFGRPVVATATGSLSEVIEEGRSGYIVAPGDERALAGAISGLLISRERAKEMGGYARYLASTHHAWSSIAKVIHEVYNHMLAVRGSS